MGSLFFGADYLIIESLISKVKGITIEEEHKL